MQQLLKNYETKSSTLEIRNKIEEDKSTGGDILCVFCCVVCRSGDDSGCCVSGLQSVCLCKAVYIYFSVYIFLQSVYSSAGFSMLPSVCSLRV